MCVCVCVCVERTCCREHHIRLHSIRHTVSQIHPIFAVPPYRSAIGSVPPYTRLHHTHNARHDSLPVAATAPLQLRQPTPLSANLPGKLKLERPLRGRNVGTAVGPRLPPVHVVSDAYDAVLEWAVVRTIQLYRRGMRQKHIMPCSSKPDIKPI